MYVAPIQLVGNRRWMRSLQKNFNKLSLEVNRARDQFFKDPNLLHPQSFVLNFSIDFNFLISFLKFTNLCTERLYCSDSTTVETVICEFFAPLLLPNTEAETHDL